MKDKDFVKRPDELLEDGALLSDEPEEIREAVIRWIGDKLRPAKTPLEELSSYGLKHILQHDTGIYLSNNAMKDAMICAGFDPVDPEETNCHYLIHKRSPALARKAYPTPCAAPHPAQVKRWEGE